MKKQYDILYPIGAGSQWNDAELRYSLRAIEQNLKGYRNIFIVGRCPDFIDKSKVIHIPADDPLNSNADGNISLKVLKACQNERLSDDFLFINDDHIINKSMRISDIGYYHKGNFADFPESFWNTELHRRRLKRTFEILKERGLSTYHFDLHVPIIFNKQKFKQTIPSFDFTKGIGFTTKSIYANPVIPDTKKEFIGERKKKIFKFLKIDTIAKVFDKAKFISYNDFGLNGELKYFLAKRYPERSQYELYDKEKEPSEIIREYLNTASIPMIGKEYAAGIDLFRKHGRNSNLLMMFQRKHSRRLEEKLIYKLQLLSERY